MTSLTTGGGSSAVAASTHAACERFRSTDPLITGQSRRALAQALGHPDTTAGIPEARWMRAMTFERLVRSDDFVSPLLTTTVGAVGLPRPDSVRRGDAKVQVAATAAALAQAHQMAVDEGVSTMLTGLAVPYVGFEDDTSTPVKPDFAVIVPRRVEGDPDAGPVGSWLIVGDAKDYERVRSRITDARMLKGFLQVALGAESLAAWSLLPSGMEVHRYGALAVPRNSFLQPMAVVEQLDDHRAEVRARAQERRRLMEMADGATWDADQVTHLTATYDPSTCAACSLFSFCRHQLRTSEDPADLLVEIGVPRSARVGVLPLVEGGTAGDRVPRSLVNQVAATTEGTSRWSARRRVDQAGQPGTVDVVLAKSDSAALGVHGIGVRAPGAETWRHTFFQDAQSPQTRLRVMEILGEQLEAAMRETARQDPVAPSPVHLVVPDRTTGDVLVSIADSLAGVELSRIRWQRDVEQGRTPLTFGGAEATIPAALTDRQRLAVSFLLEEDRARAMRLRCPLVYLVDVLSNHVIPGGPRFEAGRLDYLVRWATARSADHRAISDAVAASPHTPGARLTNATSDAVHNALRADPEVARRLVLEELTYKAQVVEDALAVLDGLPDSALREAHRAVEGDAQEVWRRRLRLRASDLVRFGRVYWWWRNRQVEMLEKDRSCGDVLAVLTDPDVARDRAVDAGKRELSRAVVASTSPLVLRIDGRAVKDGQKVVLVTHNGDACLDDPAVTVKINKGGFKLSGAHAGPLTVTERPGEYEWTPKIRRPGLGIGDELVIADGVWLGLGAYNKDVSVGRPGKDETSAPKSSCTETSYLEDPDSHAWCCRTHELGEAEYADDLAEKRANGQLNPQVWPPVIDLDEFDVIGVEEAGAEDVDEAAPDGREALTMDDLD
ncbi:hypothetical protein ACI3ET_00040 [Ornithinimicrobium sp. LYQ121]|uniref:hypothetical protein n=1 Tax=Ornithinimicrobium sp. LYQ121 TaxID=3378801 RepID=UPI003854C917